MPLPLALLERVTLSCTAPPHQLHVRQLSSSAFCRAVAAAAPKPRKPKDEKAQFYSKSLNLPTTPFPLRADAGKREKLFWRRTTDELYRWQAEQTDRPLFVLHDGPPYANGNLHTGHALNKITKDIINRSKLIQGSRVHYVPGYDTHGLPLELKALSALKLPAASLTPQVIRSAARKEAEKGIQIQGEEFRSFAGMGAFADEDAYKTMEWGYEKRQLGIVREMVRKGLIVTHHRPTLYSPSSRTALAEAELEYREDHISRSVYVSFPVSDLGSLAPELQDLELEKEKISLAVWTTTAWTLPSNVAVAISETMDYSLVRVSSSSSLLIMASERVAALSEILSSTLETLATFPGSSLLSTTYTCPLSSSSSTSTPRTIFPASYVTSTTGTGLVHTAPAHGVEDWEAWRAHQLALHPDEPLPDTLCAVDGAGKLMPEVLETLVEPDVAQRLGGKDVLGDGTGAVIEVLQERGALLKEVEVQHKFPYDWRTKKPVIFRASSQWFANLENVKEDAVKAIEDVEFVPSRGRKTLEMYVRGRSEWCISRQRAWGVPIPVVYSYPSSCDPVASSTPYLSPSNVDHIISVLDAKGSGTDYWWIGEAEEFVEPEELARSKAEGRSWRKGVDTMDVWFDSGCSWTMLRDLNLRPESPEKPYADVYLEGSDQHRGWFQSSLLTAVSAAKEVGGKKQAPYGTVITHGMVLDEKGRKMSKSLGNILPPSTIIKGGKNLQKQPAYGTDLLRVWVASVDSTRDVLIGPAVLAQTFEALRKMRNTARFMLGNTAGAVQEEVPVEELSLIDRYILHELYELDQLARDAYNTYTFSRVYQALATFSNTTLSSFYFDVIKDSLYADAKTSPERRRVVYTLQKVLDSYTSILAPMAPLLAEEIHHFAQGAGADPKADVVQAGSVFEKVWTSPSESWNSPETKSEMEELFKVREEVMSLLEQAREKKLIGSSTEATVVISNPPALLRKHAEVLKTLFIVSDVSLVDETPTPSAEWHFSSGSITVQPATLAKCPRCWTFSKPAESEKEVCARCHEVVGDVPHVH